MSKNKKLKELDQIDGKVAGEMSFRTLDSLIGESSSSPYKQNNESDYDSYLNELNSTDLHRHAEKVGLAPTNERRVMKERLMREFRKFVASRSLVSSAAVNSHMNQDSSAGSLSLEARRILREGA
jgi:hypothetical protein